MSGPKGGKWRLQEEARRRLEWERRRRLAEEVQKKRTVEEFNRTLKDARSMITDFEDRISSIPSTDTDSILFSGLNEETEKIRAKYSKKLQHLAGTKLPQGTLGIRKATKRLESQLEQIKNQFDGEINAVENKEREASSIIQSDKNQKEFSARLASTKKREKNTTVDFVFSAGSEKEKNKLQGIVSDMDFSIKKIQEYMLLSGPDASGKREAEETVKLCRDCINRDFDTTAKKIEFIRKRYQHLKLVEQRLKKDISDFDNAYAQYVVECTEQGLDARSKASFESVKDLGEEIRQLQELALEMASQNYVKEQIADVMEDMGYRVISSEILRPQNSPDQDYYQFDDNSAIRVSISNEGTIMMEVLGTGDHSPLDDKEIEELLAKQEAFCQIHPDILNRMEERGIFIKDRFHQRPHRDFAKKVPIRKGSTIRKKGSTKLERKLDI